MPVFLMIIDDFDVFGPVGPSEANTPLIVDADTVLSVPIAGERFQSISWNLSKISK